MLTFFCKKEEYELKYRKKSGNDTCAAIQKAILAFFFEM